jgi:hypothetical protein
MEDGRGLDMRAVRRVVPLSCVVRPDAFAVPPFGRVTFGLPGRFVWHRSPVHPPVLPTAIGPCRPLSTVRTTRPSQSPHSGLLPLGKGMNGQEGAPTAPAPHSSRSARAGLDRAICQAG